MVGTRDDVAVLNLLHEFPGRTHRELWTMSLETSKHMRKQRFMPVLLKLANLGYASKGPQRVCIMTGKLADTWSPAKTKFFCPRCERWVVIEPNERHCYRGCCRMGYYQSVDQDLLIDWFRLEFVKRATRDAWSFRLRRFRYLRAHQAGFVTENESKDQKLSRCRKAEEVRATGDGSLTLVDSVQIVSTEHIYPLRRGYTAGAKGDE